MKAAFLIHGFATDISDFSSIIPFLKKRYDAIFLDNLPGHGINADLSDFTVGAVMDYVNKKFDEIKENYDYVDVYGYSMGGALATYLGSKKEINRLILLAPANKYVNGKIFAQKLKQEVEVLTSGNEERKKIVSYNNRAGLGMLITDLIPRYNVDTISTFMAIIRTCNTELKKSNVKTLLVRGDTDELVPESSSSFIKEYFSNLKEVIISDLGHLMLKARNYRLVLNAIKSFLDE